MKPGSSKKSSRRRVALAALAAAVVAAVIPATVLSSPPDDISLAQEVRGHVTASRRVELRAPLPEILDTIRVKRGQRVKQGQILARLDDQLQSVAVQAARVRADSVSEILQASLDVDEAQHHLKRVQSAYDRGAATEHELTRAQIAADRAKAVHAQTKDRHEVAKVQLELEMQRHARYEIKAPFDGTVLTVEADTGEMLIDEDVILVLADLDTLEANIDFPASMYGDLEIGREYTILAGAPVNDKVVATLDTIDPIIDAASQTFRCIFTIDNREPRMPAGFTVSMSWENEIGADEVEVHTVDAPTTDTP